jgi:hypothetical protein
VVLAHVPANWLTGEKALWLHRPVVGLNLYRWPAVDFVLELPLIVGGWWMLRRAQGAPRGTVSGPALGDEVDCLGEMTGCYAAMSA